MNLQSLIQKRDELEEWLSINGYALSNETASVIVGKMDDLDEQIRNHPEYKGDAA